MRIGASFRHAALLVVVGLAACQVPYAGGAKPVAPSAIGASWLRAAPVPVVLQQAETDCGLAALAMIGGAWGHHWSVGELAALVPPTRQGVKLGALRDLARRAGLDAFAIRATPADLRHELAAGRPVMLGLVLPFDHHYNLAHFEVAIAMDPATGDVVTIDPSSGHFLRRSPKVLGIEWKAAGYAALVVTGQRTAAAGTRTQTARSSP